MIPAATRLLARGSVSLLQMRSFVAALALLSATAVVAVVTEQTNSILGQDVSGQASVPSQGYLECIIRVAIDF